MRHFLQWRTAGAIMLGEANVLPPENKKLIHADEDGVHRVTLEAHGYRWYRVGGMGYALRANRDSGAGVNW